MKKFIFKLLFAAFSAMVITLLFAVPYAVSFAGILLAGALIGKMPQSVLFDTLAPDLLAELKTMREALQKDVTTKAKEEIEAELKKFEKTMKELETKLSAADNTELKKLLDEVKASVEEFKGWKVTKDEADKKNQEALDKMIIEGQRRKGPNGGGETKSFNQILEKAFNENVDSIQNFKKGDGELKIDLMPEVKAEKGKQREVKNVGDMSIAANFPGAVSLYQQVGSLIQSTYNRVWLSDVLPNGTSNASSILYPKENGGEGGAALWTDPSQDKAQIDYDLTTTSAFFKWIAGFVVVDRDMLDDIQFLLSYLQNKMLVSLKTAENSFILNGSSDTNPVTGLLDAATAYSGSYTKPVDRIIDAAYGQIAEDTDQFYTGTTVILRPRAAVAIGLNKSEGSVEYDLPAGSAAFANGKLALAGLDTPLTTAIAANTFVALDKMATMFVRRLVPELRMFEDSTLAKKNKIMFRIEERATLAIFNDSAIVTGDLDPSES